MLDKWNSIVISTSFQELVSYKSMKLFSAVQNNQIRKSEWKFRK